MHALNRIALFRVLFDLTAVVDTLALFVDFANLLILLKHGLFFYALVNDVTPIHFVSMFHRTCFAGHILRVETCDGPFQSPLYSFRPNVCPIFLSVPNVFFEIKSRLEIKHLKF